MFVSELNENIKLKKENPDLTETITNGDKIWDELFDTPESEALLILLAEEATRKEKDKSDYLSATKIKMNNKNWTTHKELKEELGIVTFVDN